jgi:hypothetical protein
MADSGDDKVDGIYVEFGGDDKDYQTAVDRIEKETTAMAKKVETDTTAMVDHVEKTTTQSSKHIQDYLRKAVPSGGPGALGVGGGYEVIPFEKLFPEFGQMDEKLGKLKKVEEEIQAVHSLEEKLRGGFEGLGGAAETVAPFLGLVSEDLAVMAEGFVGAHAALIEFAGPAALELGVFAAAVGTVTYLIGGWDAVMQAPNDTLELLKYGLKGLTLGYVDLTEATEIEEKAEADLQSTMASGQARVKEIYAERIDIITKLSETIAGLKDHSKAAEEEFSQKTLGKLQQLGVSSESASYLGSDIAEAFRKERIDEVVASLEKEAETYGKTKEEIALYKLAQDDASETDRERVRAIFARMKAVDDAKAAAKEADKEQKEREREAAQRAREEEREQARLVQEGERVHQSLRNPFEKLRDETQKAQELFMKGVLSVDDFQKALEKLARGPKEFDKTLRLKTLSESLGVKSPEFNSAADLAMRDLYRENLAVYKTDKERTPEVRESDRIRNAERIAGYSPGTFNTPDRTTTEQKQKAEEAKSLVLFNQMLVQLQLLVQNTNNKKFVTLSPAKLGSGT